MKSFLWLKRFSWKILGIAVLRGTRVSRNRIISILIQLQFLGFQQKEKREQNWGSALAVSLNTVILPDLITSKANKVWEHAGTLWNRGTVPRRWSTCFACKREQAPKASSLETLLHVFTKNINVIRLLRSHRKCFEGHGSCMWPPPQTSEHLDMGKLRFPHL